MSVSASALALGPSLLARAQSQGSELIGLRRTIHAHPELGFEERATRRAARPPRA